MTNRYTDTFYRSSLYIALAAALTATLGSLYFSEVRHYLPCNLCWYQRILMYPLVGIIAVGLLRRDINLPHYILPFSLIGQGFATYHYLLEKTNIFPAPTTCQAGIPCTTAWINWLGFITIPFLAMTAFFIITIMALVAMTSGEPAADDRPGMPWPQVAGVVIAIFIVFYAIYTLDTRDRGLALNATATGQFTPATAPIPAAPIPVTAADAAPDAAANAPAPAVDAATAAQLETGQRLYAEACAVCHGPDALGMPYLGNALVDSDVVALPDAEVLAYIRQGVAFDDPLNTTGQVMPPSGGRPDLRDKQLLAIIAHIRSLAP
jgi:disulfide bond formation protein DsbB/mono/diheme cytochrome c family protein